MNLLQVVPRVKDPSSGPSYSVTRLCQGLYESGQDVALHVLEPGLEETPPYEFRSHACSRFPGAWRLGWSAAMKKELARAAHQADVVHNHSMWMMPNIYSGKAAKNAGCRFVFSPRGTLSEWARARSRIRKRLVWWYGQKSALESADCLHVTSQKERDEVRNMGLKQAVAVIPNGIDIPNISSVTCSASSQKNLLFLSRIHPAKNVHLLLRCWKSLANDFKDWKLVIAGPLDNGYAKKMKGMAASLGLERVRFAGELTGLEKTSALATADLFVLPTNTENFGVAIAEALVHSTPVVVTKGAPWSGVVQHDCGWWVDQGEEALRSALEEAMRAPPDQLAAMGGRGRSWMKRDFAWSLVSEKMVLTYEWLLHDTTRPEWIEVGTD